MPPCGRMDGRVVEGGSLENCCTRKRTGGSNPSPSACSTDRYSGSFFQRLENNRDCGFQYDPLLVIDFQLVFLDKPDRFQRTAAETATAIETITDQDGLLDRILWVGPMLEEYSTHMASHVICLAIVLHRFLWLPVWGWGHQEGQGVFSAKLFPPSAVSFVVSLLDRKDLQGQVRFSSLPALPASPNRVL